MKEEWDSLLEMETWEKDPVTLPTGRRAIKCRWVYVIKSDGRYKARLVAKGFSQVYGIDYEETFSPVARWESIRFMLALAVLNNWRIEGMDVTTAFLNGMLDPHEEILYMEQPEGFVIKGQEHKVYRLKRSLYGLKQAARQWYERFNDTLIDNGFTPIYSDAGIYVYTREDGQSCIYVILYMDDLLLLGLDLRAIQQLKDRLKKEFKMKDLGPVKSYLGMRINHDYKNSVIDIDQEAYIIDMLKRFNMSDCIPTSLPMKANQWLTASKEPCTPQMRSDYQRIVGSLMWVMLGTRPDISFAVTRLSHFNNNPSKEHLEAAKDVLRYLRGTASYKIRYCGSRNSGLIGYADATWAEDRDGRLSTTGFGYFLAEGIICWKTRRQKSISLSSTEAEYKSMSDACCQLAWLHNFLTEIGESPEHPTPLCGDNQGAIFNALNPIVEHRTKHVDLRYHYIREFLNTGKKRRLKLYYVRTDDQIADTFTKPLAFPKFSKFRSKLGLHTLQTSQTDSPSS